MGAVTRRILQEYWRRPVYIYSKFALCIGIVSATVFSITLLDTMLGIVRAADKLRLSYQALFDGLSFQNTRLDLQGFQNLLFSMFLLTQILGTMDQQVIPRLMEGAPSLRAASGGPRRTTGPSSWRPTSSSSSHGSCWPRRSST
jgi:hypothetical protein